MTPQFVDVSSFQGTIDWVAYRAWAAQWDGVARVAMKSTEGVGFTDPNFYANRQGALNAGIDQIFYYHFARPDLGNAPLAEANWMYSVIGDIRSQDMIILDYEVEAPQATAQWALAWLVEFGPKYGKLPGIYASSYYIESRLQWPGLNAFPLWLANWQYSPDERPPIPAPWTSYAAIQYSDRVTVPGISGVVDANIFLGGGSTTMIPQGWIDNGQILTAPNGHIVQGAIRAYVLANNWDPGNVPLQDEEHADQTQDYYPSGKGWRQIFNYCEVICEESTGQVAIIGIGNELLGCRAALATAQQQITALQTQIDDNPIVAKVRAFKSALADLQNV